jgi:hypothetical protein
MSELELDAVELASAFEDAFAGSLYEVLGGSCLGARVCGYPRELSSW